MKVLVTGDRGYIGRILVPHLLEEGYEVRGIDTDYYEGCDLYETPDRDYEVVSKDVREITAEDLRGVEAIHHLAALSNDPLGKIDSELTEDINYNGTLRLANLAKREGVRRFVFSSSCSVYGTSDGEIVDEDSEVNPLTAYARSKVRAENELEAMADSEFTPVFLRNATAYGLSPRLRFDIVVNNLTGWGYTTGEVVIKSDGTPWRPLVHIRDIAQAFDLAMTADADLVRGEAFNVGREGENYQIKDLAAIVGQNVPNADVTYGGEPSPDSRTYRVAFDKIEERLGFWCEWDVPAGVRELYQKFVEIDLTEAEFKSDAYTRLDRIRALRNQKRLDTKLRWRQIDDY